MPASASGNSLVSLRFIACIGVLVINQSMPLWLFLQSYDTTGCYLFLKVIATASQIRYRADDTVSSGRKDHMR